MRGFARLQAASSAPRLSASVAGQYLHRGCRSAFEEYALSTTIERLVAVEPRGCWQSSIYPPGPAILRVMHRIIIRSSACNPTSLRPTGALSPFHVLDACNCPRRRSAAATVGSRLVAPHRLYRPTLPAPASLTVSPSQPVRVFATILAMQRPSAPAGSAQSMQPMLSPFNAGAHGYRLSQSISRAWASFMRDRHDLHPPPNSARNNLTIPSAK